jgi:aminoglycoside phosphotransferase (APT) family kinase protein
VSGDEISDAMVRTLLWEQHPDLADLELHQTVRGWANQLWRLGDELAVRLPRTPDAPDLLRKEHRWLPVLAPRLPLPVPTPQRLGEPTALFPQPWTVATWVSGEPADRAPITRTRHAADALAGFLRALHTEAPADAPTDPTRGIPMDAIKGGFDRWLGEVGDGVPDGLRDVWDDALAAPAYEGPPVWLHADLHPANVVVSDGTLSGVVDFGELCSGDPAIDLAAAWIVLPEGGDAPFFDAYANADPAMIRRARGWAVLKGLVLISIGQAGERGLPGGKPTWGPAGRRTLDRVLADAPQS